MLGFPPLPKLGPDLLAGRLVAVFDALDIFVALLLEDAPRHALALVVFKQFGAALRAGFIPIERRDVGAVVLGYGFVELSGCGVLLADVRPTRR